MNTPFPPGTLLAGRYRLLARIGAGGFGTVYQAREQRKPGRWVAIKAINMAALSAQEKIEVTDSFNREIMVLSRLRHSSLPRLLDQFTDADHWYLVLEYIEGQTLEDRLARSKKGRLSAAQTAWIGCMLCDVLSSLHEQDPPIIFRDVKPGNIMLTTGGRLYLIDFGIARRYRPGQRRDTGALGSPGYAAAEQYGCGQTTTLTDVYGLGATLQTLLTGKEPLEIHQDGLPPEVHLPTPLQDLIKSMLDPDPGRRPQQVQEVKGVLKRSLGVVRFGLIAWASTVRLPSWFFLLNGLLLDLLLLVSLWPIMSQSGFLQSPWWLPCVFLLLALVAGSCWRARLNIRRTVQTRPSAKTITFILVQQTLAIPMFVMEIALWRVFLMNLLKGQSGLANTGTPPWWLSLSLFLMGGFTFYQMLKAWSESRQFHRARTSPQPLPPRQQQHPT